MATISAALYRGWLISLSLLALPPLTAFPQEALCHRGFLPSPQPYCKERCVVPSTTARVRRCASRPCDTLRPCMGDGAWKFSLRTSPCKGEGAIIPQELLWIGINANAQRCLPNAQ